ncbi:MAG: hypothetical protein ABIF11_08815 [Nitrospirota bacterium]
MSPAGGGHLALPLPAEDIPQKQAQVKALEWEIDHLVYKLYGLTDEEIKIVEENLKGAK